LGVRRQDGAFSGPAAWPELWSARRVTPAESGDLSPHSKTNFENNSHPSEGQEKMGAEKDVMIFHAIVAF
jgi:hypothetical protein